MTNTEQRNYDSMANALRELGVAFEDTTWGNDVTANAVADNSSTIAYTLFTGITRRVPLRYINR